MCIPRLARRLTIGSAALLLTTMVACESSASTMVDPDPEPATNVPAELIGQWLHGIVSMSGYVDAYSGLWLDNAYGTSVMFQFAPDGTYKQTILIKTSAYSCRMQVYIYNEGKATFDGAAIETYPTSGTVKSMDTCNAANNYTRPDDLTRKQGQSYGWHFGKNANNPDDAQTYLILGVGAQQSPAYFRRAS
jgi:hypothetical protein